MSDLPDRDFDLPTDKHPTAERTARMERALALALASLKGAGASVSVSPLGPGWSSDLDVYVSKLAVAVGLATQAGWVPLDGVLVHLGYPDRSTFAITDDEVILAKADLVVGQAPSSADRAVDRARRLSELDVRAILEIQRLVDNGLDPTTLGHKFLGSLADAEHRIGGDRFAAFRSEQPTHSVKSKVRDKTRVQRPRVCLAVSGVDGSGKSTLTASIEESLSRCGIPFTTIWTRPGMRLSRLDRIARRIRRFRKDDLIGIERLAEGQAAETIRSRRGVVGWVWLSLVTAAYLADIRRQTRRAAGVVIYDRHLLDALGTLEALYEGVDSRVQQAFIRRFIPKADLTVWLDIDPSQAAARKPDDLIGADLVAKQASAYRRHADQTPRLRRHDANGDSFIAASQVLRELNATLATRRGGLRAALFSIARRR